MAQVALWQLLLFLYVFVPIKCMWMPENPYFMDTYQTQPETPRETLKNLIQMQRQYNRQNEEQNLGRMIGIKRGKRPFFVQPIVKPVEARRSAPPLKRVVCNGVNDPNCNYLFTFLNRS